MYRAVYVVPTRAITFSTLKCLKAANSISYIRNPILVLDNSQQVCQGLASIGKRCGLLGTNAKIIRTPPQMRPHVLLESDLLITYTSPEQAMICSRHRRDQDCLCAAFHTPPQFEDLRRGVLVGYLSQTGASNGERNDELCENAEWLAEVESNDLPTPTPSSAPGCNLLCLVA